jgi:hypothetical protein
LILAIPETIGLSVVSVTPPDKTVGVVNDGRVPFEATVDPAAYTLSQEVRSSPTDSSTSTDSVGVTERRLPRVGADDASNWIEIPKYSGGGDDEARRFLEENEVEAPWR